MNTNDFSRIEKKIKIITVVLSQMFQEVEQKKELDLKQR